MSYLIQKLFREKLDIIGDIHGELEALKSLMKKMNYSEDGEHPENRKLIFVGDLVDRGPDSPGVVLLVKKLVENGNAQMVLGNHELNLLQHKAKSGAGWYFETQQHKDKDYAPFNVVKESQREEIISFLSKMPIILENEDLRVVHAAWLDEKVNEIKSLNAGDVAKDYMYIERNINKKIKENNLLENYHLEQEEWQEELEDENANLPFLEYSCEYALAHQMGNPMRVLTSGVEVRAEKKFFASGKWRFVQRQSWWDFYEDKKPVIVGHFWRKHNSKLKQNDENIFQDIDSLAWHGKNNNVFCVDYSVGARFLERKHKKEFGSYGKLGALRFDMNEIWFENGEIFKAKKA